MYRARNAHASPPHSACSTTLTTSSACCPPSLVRSTRRATSAPTSRLSRVLVRSEGVLIGVLPTAVMMSPAMMPCSPRRVGSSPALSAAPPGTTACSSAPRATLSRAATASLATVTPSEGRVTLPFAMSCGTTRATVSAGMANPTPTLVPVLVKMAVLMPTSAPELSSSGPPLLPGLMAASVWMPPGMDDPTSDLISRLSPLTTPVVSVWSKPNGLPTASTCCPTRSPALEPSSAGCSSSGGALTRTTARSRLRSVPTSVASYVRCTPSRPSSVTRATRGCLASPPGPSPLRTLFSTW
mmetsp:Transcript_28635/g.72866  ORF Transcript_28635/g.72866 Transcript_28635/m.72866 type:complete len:298 (-) Transcript_28635:467-1360(-)